VKIIDCIQGSEEWYKVRCGIPTSSEFDKIITTKGERSKQREKYLYRLAGERISKTCEETYQSEAMLKGKALEDEARKYYELINKLKVKQVGFILQEKPGYGCSPDGGVRKNGLLEIKCPLLSTHVNYLYNWSLHVPPEYFVQIQGQLLVTNRDWCDFMSYCVGMRPLIIRVKREKGFLFILEAELRKFCSDLDRIVRKIK
jgi:putative phage-type endonuclease